MALTEPGISWLGWVGPLPASGSADLVTVPFPQLVSWVKTDFHYARKPNSPCAALAIDIHSCVHGRLFCNMKGALLQFTTRSSQQNDKEIVAVIALNCCKILFVSITKSCVLASNNHLKYTSHHNQCG